MKNVIGTGKWHSMSQRFFFDLGESFWFNFCSFVAIARLFVVITANIQANVNMTTNDDHKMPLLLWSVTYNVQPNFLIKWKITFSSLYQHSNIKFKFSGYKVNL